MRAAMASTYGLNVTRGADDSLYDHDHPYLVDRRGSGGVSDVRGENAWRWPGI